MDQNDSHYAATYVSNSGSYSKEQRDVALASTLLKLGILSERQLSGALASWTLHGNVPLGEHLINRGLLTTQALIQAETEADRRLAGCSEEWSASKSHSGRSGSVIARTLSALDTSGTISKLLGIRGSAGAAVDDGRDSRQSIVRYKLLRKLGQGGLGRVWLAFDENLKRHVAVKEIAAARDPIALQRFRREAEITGRLEHPGIVPIYELGEDLETGDVFYAMRFLGKQTLHDAILEYHERRSEGTDDPMLIRQLLTAFVNVCQAIGHAHSRKVIHRDLKPENVAIDSFGQVIVIDWGLAKVVDETGLGDLLPDAFAGDIGSHQQTMDGQVLGTPLYMSPEQAAGRLDELNEKTDIYGLGAILFAILTGSAPHELARANSTISGGGQRDLLTAIAGKETPAVRSLNPSVDPALAAVCEKALARRQYARYETATQLSDDIQRWMAGESVSAYREKLPQQLGRWVQQHRLISQAIAATLTIIVVSLITMAISSRQHALSQRAAQFQALSGQEHELQSFIQGLADHQTRDVRFMSTIPPIAAIIEAKEDAGRQAELESAQHRLTQTFEGLMRANTNYLSISYFGLNGERPGLGRVERQFSGSGYLRIVPDRNLGTFTDAKVAERLGKLFPGEVWLDLIEKGATAGVVKLAAYIPIYDDATGNQFGFVVIESDLTQQLKKVLVDVELQGAMGYLTNAAGQIWVEGDSREVHEQLVPQSVSEILPGLAKFFADPQTTRYSDPASGTTALRMRLDRSNPNTTIALVLSLKDTAP